MESADGVRRKAREGAAAASKRLAAAEKELRELRVLRQGMAEGCVSDACPILHTSKKRPCTTG